MPKKITLLGATGSVGTSVLSVMEHFPEEFILIGFSAWNNITATIKIIEKFSPKYVVLNNPNQQLEKQYPEIVFLYGDQGLTELAQLEEHDSVVSAVTGTAGLKPSIETLRKGKQLIIANKESLVAGGQILMKTAKKHSTEIIPLDSEHLALFDLLRGKNHDEIEEMVLTASGGPFRTKEITTNTSIEDVLQHPTWSMGKHITVSSALMLNKGLEIIEAMRLFDIPEQKIRVLVHPQSLIHAALNMKGGHWHFLASPADMRYPALHALYHPKHPQKTPFDRFDPFSQSLEFYEPDYKKFPLLQLARDIGKADGILPAVLCGSMETAIGEFLKGNILFYHLPDLIKRTLLDFENKQTDDIEEILYYDQQARTKTQDHLKKHYQ